MLFLLGCVPAGQEEDFRIDAYFCPESDCEKVLTQNLLQASSMIHCAFYDIDDPELIDALTQKQRSIEVRIVTDGDNDKGQLLNLTYEADDENQLMHNKFCTIDGKRVVTGSLNPTESGAGVNNNNLLLIDSPILAGIYEEEFRELWNRDFGEGQRTRMKRVSRNSSWIQVHFCPEDECGEYLVREILQAKDAIYFLTFAFTDERVADAVLMSDAKDVRGVFDTFQAGQRYSQYRRLRGFGLDVLLDKNPGLMHHKVFIIDNATVVTGSFNPTSAADSRNDENMVIIRDQDIARAFLEEFMRIEEKASGSRG